MSSSIIVPRDVWKLIIDKVESFTITKDTTFVIRDDKNTFFVKLKDITNIRHKTGDKKLHITTCIYNEEGGYESYYVYKDCNPKLFDLLTKWLSTVYIL